MRKLMFAVIVVFVLSFGCFAANLDDPVPQTPTIRSELQAGYAFGETIFKNNCLYDMYSVMKIAQHEGIEVERDKSQAYQIGYWFSIDYLLLAKKKANADQSDIILLNGYVGKKVRKMIAELGLTEQEVCGCFNIDYSEYQNLIKY